MTKDRLATFRIDPDLWEAFKNKANSNQTSASALLNNFIRAYLADRVEFTTQDIEQQIEAIASRIVDERFREVSDRLGELSAA